MADDTDVICLACTEEMSESELQIKCTECQYSYHLGNCAGISEATLKKNANIRKTWRCQTCRAAKSRSSQSSRPPKEQGAASGTQSDVQTSEVNVAVLLVGMNAILDTLLNLKETVDGLKKSL